MARELVMRRSQPVKAQPDKDRQPDTAPDSLLAPANEMRRGSQTLSARVIVANVLLVSLRAHQFFFVGTKQFPSSWFYPCMQFSATGQIYKLNFTDADGRNTFDQRDGHVTVVVT